MKNFLPLVLAVVLGLAAVLGVRHVLAQRNSAETAMVTVVAASQDIPLNGVLTGSSLIQRQVPKSALPAKAIDWSMRNLLVNQRTLRVILRGDYIQWSDVGSSNGVSNLIGEGEWAVTVPFSDAALASSLRPGDEIAIVGTFTAQEENGVVNNGGKAAEGKKKTITATLLPRVRIISVGDNGVIVLSLKPDQAQFLIDAQRQASLYPVLRRPNDNQNLDRLKTGMVDKSTYDKLLKGQHAIEIPAVPGNELQ